MARALWISRTLTVREFRPGYRCSEFSAQSFEGQCLLALAALTDLSGLADSWTGTVRYDGGSALPLPIQSR